MKYPETRLFLVATPHATYPCLLAFGSVALQCWTSLPPKAFVPVVRHIVR